MKPIFIPATLLLMALYPLQAQDNSNAPAGTPAGTNDSTHIEAPATGARSLFGRSTNALAPHVATNVADSPVMLERDGEKPVSAMTATSPNKMTYASFKVIADHNIFDATRSPAGSRGIKPPPKVTRKDYFKLLGTICYDKGRFAFFDGSGSDFRGTIQTGQAVAEYKIVEIGYNGVKLLGTNGTPLELTVGMQMKREDDGPWSVALAGESFSSSSSLSESTEKSSDAPSGSNDAENEVMKRLMQKRAKELNK